MSNSSLIDVIKKSPNHSGKRTHSIDRITPHCVVGQLTASAIGECFPAGRKASCNYGIGSDAKVVLVVDECNRSWCSSNGDNDQRAVTIECASNKAEPYAFTEKVYNKLIDLCVDICKRNKKTKLIWFGNKDNTLNYSPKSNEMVLTVHRWFANKSCPGNWLYSRMGELAETVTKRLSGTSTQPEKKTETQEVKSTATDKSFKFKVTISDLCIRKGAGTDYAKHMKNGKPVYTGKSTFTIIKTKKGKGATLWGLLKSYEKNEDGWIALDSAYGKRV